MKKINFYYLLKSLLFFLKLLLRRQKYDVVFAYLNHFNRGENGVNDLLAPMIESCKRNNIRYIVFEDTDLKGAYGQYPRNEQAVPFDFITLLRILFRKVYGEKSLTIGKNDQYLIRERILAKTFKKTLFRNFDFKLCINMAGDNLTFFRGLNSKALVCEYQHGIVYDGHADYMINGKADNYIVQNSAIFLLFGKGFQSLLINRDQSGYYDKSTTVNIGTDFGITDKTHLYLENIKTVLFSLQITPDFPYHELEKQVDTIHRIMQENAAFLEKNNYTILFKHHPRFDAKKCPNIEIKYPFMKLVVESSLNDLLEQSSLHMTFVSTTAFEAGLLKIPTIFIDMEPSLSPEEIFFNQYRYPLKELKIENYSNFQNILKKLEDPAQYAVTCQKSHDWAKSYYGDFDENKFINFIQKGRF